MKTAMTIEEMYFFEINNFKKIHYLPEITIPECKLEKIHSFAEEIVKFKTQESGYKYDHKSIYTRHYTGKFSEVALEEYLKVEFVDWRIGQSIEYNYADLSPLKINMGIKSVREGNFPLIDRKPRIPQIINIKKNNKAYILGVATIDYMKSNYDDSLVRDPRVIEKGIKTCLSSFSGLLQFKTLDELQKINMDLLFESF